MTIDDYERKQFEAIFAASESDFERFMRATGMAEGLRVYLAAEEARLRQRKGMERGGLGL